MAVEVMVAVADFTAVVSMAVVSMAVVSVAAGLVSVFGVRDMVIPLTIPMAMLVTTMTGPIAIWFGVAS
jgi:hypothetical protein